MESDEIPLTTSNTLEEFQSGQSGCSSNQVAIINSDHAFFSWYSTNTEKLNTYIQKKVYSGDEITDIEGISGDIFSMSKCLENSIQSSSSAANQIFQMHEQIITLQDQMEQEEENMKIAKDRLSYSKEPTKHLGNYSSWFPSTRPLYFLTILILLAITLFISIFGLLFLLSFIGVDVSFFQNTMYDSRMSSYYASAAGFSSSFWAAIAVIIGLVIYIAVRK